MINENLGILQSIDYLDDIVQESEINVLTALCDVYEKTCTIMEHYEGDALSDFDIFQEGFVQESDDVGKKENIIKKILLFIPRLIKKLIQFIKKAWDNRKSQQLLRRLESLENLTEEQKRQIADLDNRIKRSEKFVLDQIDNSHDVLFNMQMRLRDDVSKLEVDSVEKDIKIRDLKDKTSDQIKDVRVDIKRNSIENERLMAIIDTMNGVVITHIDFKSVIEYYKEILTLFDSLDNWNIHKPSTLSKNNLKRINSDLSSGKSTDGHSWILGGKEYKCKYSEVAEYVSEWNKLRTEVCDKGTTIGSKIEKMGKDYESALRNGDPNKSQQEKLDNVNTVLKYIKNILKSTMACERIISQHFNHMNALLSKYDSVINPKH